MERLLTDAGERYGVPVPLNPPKAADRPGRMPLAEQKGIAAFLEGNGWPLEKRKKAYSGDGHRDDLNARHTALLLVEAKFDGPKVNPKRRREIRAELAPLYVQLLATAAEYEASATVAYDELVDRETQRILDVNPRVEWLYKGKGKEFDRYIMPLDPAALDPRVGTFADRAAFQSAVEKKFKRTREFEKKGAPDAALVAQQQADTAMQQTERGHVTNQLAIWRNGIALNAPGCNENGTWGTSAGGAGTGFAPSVLNARVFNSLRGWWVNQADHAADEWAYVTPSLTTTYSLKMFRPSDTQSETFNYHVDIGDD